jgi:hypothetical protein
MEDGGKMAEIAKRIRALADEVEACGSGEMESQEEESGEEMGESSDKSQMLKLASASIKQGMKKNI